MRLTVFGAASVALFMGAAQPSYAWWWNSQPATPDTTTVDVVGIDTQANDTTHEVPPWFEMPDFYTKPASWPQMPGQLIAYQQADLDGWVGRIGEMHADLTLIMYTTTNELGDIVPVTGAFLQPHREWSGSSQRPLVTYAYGTVGQGDQCAPSLSLTNPLQYTPNSISANYEILGISYFIRRGVPVVQTDYIGFGLPGNHTYVNRVDQGNAVLDAVRAAAQLPGSGVVADTPVAAFGYSQGGAATASAAELARSYAPDVNLVSAYVGAPPADLEETIKGIDGSPLALALAFNLNGLRRYYDDVNILLDAEQNDRGERIFRESSRYCVLDAIVSPYAGESSSKWTSSGRKLGDILYDYPAALEIARRNKIGNIKPDMKVRVATSVWDDVVPHGQSRELAVDWCDAGADVKYVPVFDVWIPGKSLVNHVNGMILDQYSAVQWTMSTLRGESPRGNCSLLRWLP